VLLTPLYKADYSGVNTRSAAQNSLCQRPSVEPRTRLARNLERASRHNRPPPVQRVDVGENQLGNEIAFLKTEIYRNEAEPRLQTLTALSRFSVRAYIARTRDVRAPDGENVGFETELPTYGG
jgi:hypothetical protein